MKSSYSPDSSEKYAIRRPSGDQIGQRSCAPVVFVRFLTSPFSAGTERISPRNSTASRAPDGERDARRTYLTPFTNRGRVSCRSAATPIGTRALVRAFGSKTWIQPACSYTIRPAPDEACRIGKSVWFVTRAAAFAFSSHAYRLNSPSRSERKYTVSPTHIGAASFER